MGFAGFLKQSTAVDISLGPFVDSTDGVTAETGLTISQADVRLKKNNGAWAQVNDNTSATHEENGYYEKELDATDTNTVGILRIAVSESGALPVLHDYYVLEEAIYDALFAASANAFTGAAGSTTLTALADNGITAAKIASDAITAAKIAADAITAAKIADGAIDAATFAAGAINAAAIAADAITAAKVAADVSAEIADAVWDEDATAHQTGGTFGQAIGDPGADTTTIYQSVVTDAVGANIAADIADVEGKVDDLESRLGTPSDLGSGATVGDNLSDIRDDTLAHAIAILGVQGSVDALPSAADVVAAMVAEFCDDAGTAQAGGATSITLRAAAVATDDYYNGAVVKIVSGTGADQSRRITDYNGTTKVATVDSAWSVNPDNTSVYIVLGRIV